MNKPKLTEFQRFAKITLQRYERYLPTAFDESLTLLEKMNKLIEYLNQMGILVNDVVEQWNEVMEWIINDGITDTVLDRLDEMVDDGTLATIINEHIFEELNNKVDQKADKDYVDSELDKKADNDYVDGELDKKSDLSYVDSEINDINDMMAFKVTKTTENIEYHVSLTGNDNNSGTSSNPFRTIAKAVSMIPDTIGEDTKFSIVIGNGSWNENIEVGNVTVNGQLEIKGNTSSAGNHSVDLCVFNNITGHLSVSNIMTRSQTTVGFRFNRCTYAIVTNVIAHGEPDSDVTKEAYLGLLADYGSNVLVINSQFNYKRHAIRSNYLSRIFSQNNSGTGNSFGISARWGGIISTYGDQPRARVYTYNQSTDSGGLIIDGSGVAMGLPRGDLYLVGRTTDALYGRYYKKQYFINSVNAQNVAVTAGQQIKLRFKGVAIGPHRLNIKYSGSRPPGASSQHIECVWTGTLSASNFRTPEMTSIYRHDFHHERVEVVHAGSGLEFDVIISPISADSGQWAVEVETQIMRNENAPNLIDVVVE